MSPRKSPRKSAAGSGAGAAGAGQKAGKPLAPVKITLLTLHLLALLVFVAGVSLIYCNVNFKKGFLWMDEEAYEDSPAFTELLTRETAQILNYVKYRDVFESGGEVDPDNEVFAFSTGTGEEQIWTLNDVQVYAQNHGYSLDNNYHLVRDPSAPSGEEEAYPVTWRAYRTAQKLSGPGAAYVSLEHMAREVLTCLGEYYASLDRFNTGNSNLSYLVEIEGRRPYTNHPGMTEDFARSMGRYVILDTENPLPDNNLGQSPNELRDLIQSEVGSFDLQYRVLLAVDTTYPLKDAFYFGVLDYARQRELYAFGVLLMLAGAAAMAFTLLPLLFFCGRRVSGDGTVTLRRIDRRIPEANVLLFASGCILLLFLADKTGARLIHMLLPERFWVFAEKMMMYVIIYLTALPLLFSLCRQYKARVLWKQSFLQRLLVSANEFARGVTFARRLFIYFAAWLFANLALCTAACYLVLEVRSLAAGLTAFFLVILLLLLNGWYFRKLYQKQHQSDLLAEAIRSMGTGEAVPLESSDFSGREAALAETINNVNENLQKALDDRVKSERMKAELITNVSHDIKTPLTSIINYVDLMKRLNPEDPRIVEYLNVLDQKSHHLKILTEDLVEASKASTGNIQMTFADIDFTELTEQTNGEFEERFEERSMQLIANLPKEPLFIHADGQHLWRVLENLYNNAVKYAAPNSRVYVDLNRVGPMARFTIKNISASPLNISPEELTERFVRGDVSRSTEGSGLGLSIAKSLTELQHGDFAINIDGDYFKASVTFRLVNPGAAANPEG